MLRNMQRSITLFFFLLSSAILETESNLKPLWLTEVTCTSTDQSLGSCIREDNIVGFANCENFDIAAVDCGKCISLVRYHLSFGMGRGGSGG